MNDETPSRGRAVPRGRLSRLSVFGRLAGGVAGGVIAEGARRLANGQRPKMNDLFLTPGNVMRVADQLSNLRGAAMKLGQMISMDAGDILPPELSQILARLRERAHHMPPSQLQQVLSRQWGKDWRHRFARFDASPLAAASIGQVHRARTLDGRDLAIKVQYPGVRDSIDVDVDNVATLLRVSGVLPRSLDIASLLAEAKQQLHEEADYAREAGQLSRFGALLSDSADYVVPTLDHEFSGDSVLAMSFVEGRPIESLVDADQATRDAAMEKLISLVLRELFEFGVMQTDPNFANYRWQSDTGKLVLLDFGAVRDISAETADAYRTMLEAGISRDRDAVRDAAVTTGFLGEMAVSSHRAAVDRIIDAVLSTIERPGPFDFGDRAFVPIIRAEASVLGADRATWHVPPIDTLFVQRKVSGTALLAARLKARVDIVHMASSYLLARSGDGIE